MPYPSEHACRLESPDKYDRFARKNCEQKHDGKCIDVIYGFSGDSGGEIQALRYPKKVWTAADARSHCKSRDGSFEAAAEEESKAHRVTPLELRTYPVTDFRIEQRSDRATKFIVGHAAVFDTVAGPEWWRERISRGAFAESIKQDDVRALFNHDPNLILGRNVAGTLRLEEDDKGLLMDIDIPDTTLGRDLTISIDRGDISQASFAFQVVSAVWETKDEEEIRVLNKVKLYDVSPVTYAFYDMTDVTLRSADSRQKEIQKRIGQKILMKQRRRRLDLLQHTLGYKGG